MTLTDFKDSFDPGTWEIVNDVVMGGRSAGHFQLEKEGIAVFSGEVSLENNGGFTLVRHRFDPVEVSRFSKVLLHLRGDGKRYQFRVKSDPEEQHAYVQYFETSGDWQTVELALAELYPTYKGRRLEIPDFSGRHIAEIGLLIGNGRAESFRLELKEVSLQ
jgi:hypothetical protein